MNKALFSLLLLTLVLFFGISVSHADGLNVTVKGEQASALKDGMLIARYMQGLRGEALLADIAESEDATSVEQKLADLYSHLDIDLDGNITAEHDGKLVISYLLGFRGNTLTNGLLAAGATRSDPADVEQYLNGLLSGSILGQNQFSEAALEALLIEVNKVLEDDSIPNTTEEEFNNSEYAKHHLPDDEAQRLEMAHQLVATAIDPDPEWFMTNVDKSVVLGEAGKSYIIQLKKKRVDGSIIGPVDNDKLRLVVRIQRSKDNFEHVDGADIEKYAKWKDQGILEIHVPDNLNQGRLLIGVRPNFEDEATNAIAERWSTVVIAEVWQTKINVIMLDDSSVLFPIDNDASKGFAEGVKFTKEELSDKVQEQLTQNNVLTLPIIIQDKNLQKGQLVSYMFRDSPYSGRILSIETKGDQQFALLSPEVFDVYEITDGNEGFLVEQGVYPEHVIFREGEVTTVEGDQVKPKIAISKDNFFETDCEPYTSMLTFEPIFKLSPLDAGINVAVHSFGDELKCEWKAATDKDYYFAIDDLFGAITPTGIVAKMFGAGGKLVPYGKVGVNLSGIALSLDTGYSLRNGVKPISMSWGVAGFLDKRNLNMPPAKSKAEFSFGAGAKVSLYAISNESTISVVIGWILNDGQYELSSLGLEADAGVKGAFVAEALNASEVYKSGESSKFTYKLDFGIAIGLTKNAVNFFKSVNLDIKPLKLMFEPDPVKLEAIYTFSLWDDDGYGSAKITDLRLRDDYPSVLRKILPETVGGVLSNDDIQSIFNDEAEDIKYSLLDCESNNYQILSPVIACSGWMCGKTIELVELCKKSSEPPSLSAPQNLQTVPGDGTVTLSWDAVNGATKYGICQATESITRYADCTSYAGGVVTDTATPSKTLTGLVNGTQYHFRVIALDADGKESLASTEVTATPQSTTQPTVPAIPTGTTPGGSSSPGLILSSQTVTLSWSASSGATIYDYGIRDVDTGVLVVASTTSTTSATHTLDAGGHYRWNVRACNGSVSNETCSGFTEQLYFQTSGNKPTSKLNDTGITTCANGTQNNVPCPVTDYPGQDGDFGRDVTANDDNDGHAGFSFTKIGANGEELPASATAWSCVKDNVTGLMWEVKTDDGGLHDKDDRYTWYEPDSSKNGGFAGYQKPSDSSATSGDAICYGFTDGNATTYCNTYAYVRRVNTETWCGVNDWRLPTKEELHSIASYGRSSPPAIDTTWFPNTPLSTFWSSSPVVAVDLSAWHVSFGGYGDDGWNNKDDAFQARLVRGGQ